MKIGFVGMGNMGAPMAANLAAAGHDVTGFDPVTQPVGLRQAASAAAAAQEADVVITMLPDGAILRAVAAEIHPVMRRGAIHLDCSTVDVETARSVAQAAIASGLGAMDAPVSGGIGGATQGTLTFMAGGTDATFATLAPLFDAMGRRAILCGAAGAGQAAKLCNNMILGVTMIATCEAFVLADSLGLDRQALYDVVSTSSGQSWSLTSYCPAPGIGPTSPADSGYRPGFAAALMRKDLDLAQQAASDSGAAPPVGAQAATLYREFAADGGSGQDFSAILPWLGQRGRK